MRQITLIILAIILITSFSACSQDKTETDTHTKATNPVKNVDRSLTSVDNMYTPCTKDSVDEFIAILGEIELGGLSTGFTLDEEHCYNVTPEAVAIETNVKIFKFSNTCTSFALIDGEIFEICQSFGGYGFVNAVPWDYDEDGNLDLLIAASWGSGLHRSEISVFNTKTKESIMVFSTASTSQPNIDLIVASSSFSSEISQDDPMNYQVFSVNIAVNNKLSDYNLADLSYEVISTYGSICVENDVPVFKPFESK